MNRKFVIKNWISFSLAACAVLCVAFGLLPRLSRLPAVKSRTLLNEEKKINGGATFYTDHEFMNEILARKERR